MVSRYPADALMRHQHGVLESAASSRRGDDPVMLRPSLPLGEGRTQCAGSACVTTTKRFRLLEKKPRTASAIFTMLLLWLLFLFREQVSLGADLPRHTHTSTGIQSNTLLFRRPKFIVTAIESRPEEAFRPLFRGLTARCGRWTRLCKFNFFLTQS